MAHRNIEEDYSCTLSTNKSSVSKFCFISHLFIWLKVKNLCGIQENEGIGVYNATEGETSNLVLVKAVYYGSLKTVSYEVRKNASSTQYNPTPDE